MKKSLLYQFLNKQISREEFRDLHEAVNHDQEAVMDSIEKDWEEFQLEEKVIWPEKNWDAIHQYINTDQTKKSPAKVFRLRWAASIAATLLVTVSVWFVFDAQKSTENPSDGPSLITEVNDSDQPSIVVLRDGTKVTLTAHSSISYYTNFNNRYRVVRLDGEAYFETDVENARPFVVVSENITSICRGKEFSISAYKESDEINVTLASGQIEISRNDKLNSENNKVAVKSCQRYSFSKTKDEYLIGQISDCEYDEKAQSMREAASKNIVML